MTVFVQLLSTIHEIQTAFDSSSTGDVIDVLLWIFQKHLIKFGMIVFYPVFFYKKIIFLPEPQFS